ncbi:MAG: ASKHA domain-containing protein, partial [Phycisphaerae bacterium]
MSLCGSFELPTRRIELELAQPCLVIDAAEQAGIVLNTSCARLGTCGGCAVDLLQGRFELAGQTVTVGPPDRKRVLGCQCTILSDRWRIAVPRRSLVETHETFLVDFDLRPTFNLQPLARKIRLHLPRPSLEDSVGDFERICRTLRRDHGFERIRPTLRVLQQLPELIAQADYQLTVTLAENYGLWEMVQVEPGDTSDRLFAIAADIGTTTVACCLIDLTTGRIIDSASCYNQQIQRCDDVASRIVSAQQPDRLRELQQLIVGQTINKLISLLCRNNGLRPDEVVRLVVSGNTVMAHLFLGINPKNMGGVPFQPGTSGPGTFRARPLAVGINPDGFVDIVPSISAYVGGDIISDIHVAGLARQQGLALLIDVGTNGEMAVGNADRILACATPAGPAFEGGGITCGTRATAGAIHALTIESDSLAAACQVIADLKPIGVCGSGLIDFLAEARRVGLIDHAGRFNPRLVGTCPYLRQTASHDRGRFEYVLVPRQAT